MDREGGRERGERESIIINYPTFSFHVISPRLTSELQLTVGSNTETVHSKTLGSVISLGSWHHLSISVLPLEMQPVYKVSNS